MWPKVLSTTDAINSTSSSSNAIEMAKPPSAPESTSEGGAATNRKVQTSAAAFASSGFAALSGSSTSPFGTLGARSTVTGDSPFTSVAVSSVKGSRGNDMIGNEQKMAEDGTLGSTAMSTSSYFDVMASSNHNSAGTSNLRTFGGSSFGTGFGSAFRGAPKLTSFAAPAGDTKWGSGATETKPFGAPAQDPEEEEASGTEDEVESNKAPENDEADVRFQQQGGRSLTCLGINARY